MANNATIDRDDFNRAALAVRRHYWEQMLCDSLSSGEFTLVTAVLERFHNELAAEAEAEGASR